MKALLRLPPELLLRIFGFVGAEFFRADLGRLTISKRWYGFAWEVFASHLVFTDRQLLNFIRGTREDFLSDFGRYERYVTAVDVNLAEVEDGFDGFGEFYDDLPSSNDNEDVFMGEIEDAALDRFLESYADIRGLSTKVQTSDLGGNQAHCEPMQLSAALLRLAAALKSSQGLRHLRLRAGSSSTSTQQQVWLPTQTILWMRPLEDMLSMQHLTSLDFDTTCAQPNYASAQPRVHLCRSISVLLPSLQRLRCRMDHICEAVLDLPPHYWEASKDLEATRDPRSLPRLQLTEVIINLSISELSDTLSSYRYPRRCLSDSGWMFPALKDIMETKAAALAKRLDNPQMVRVISHTFPSLTTVAFDAITGKRCLLQPKEAWDAAGIPAGESVPENYDDDGSDVSLTGGSEFGEEPYITIAMGMQ